MSLNFHISLRFYLKQKEKVFVYDRTLLKSVHAVNPYYSRTRFQLEVESTFAIVYKRQGCKIFQQHHT